jgi:putative ABC transport system permease protein
VTGCLSGLTPVRFIDVIVKNVVRRKTRSALTASGLAAAVAASTALLSLTWGYAGSAARFYSARGVDLVVVRAGVADRSTSNLDAALVGRLASLPGVAAAEGSLTERVAFGGGSVVGVPLQGLDPDGFAIKALTVVSGRPLHPGDRHQILLGTALAKSLEKKLGETVQIEGTKFQVAGLFHSDDLMDAATAVAVLADVQELSERPHGVSEIQIRMASPGKGENDAALRQLCAQIEALHDDRGEPLGLRALPTTEFVNSDANLQLATATAWGTSIMAIVLSLFITLNTMLVSVLERTREFGMLRAVGWRRARIVWMILGEALVIGFVAALVGTLGAWCFVGALAAWPSMQSIVNSRLSPAAVFCGASITVAAGLIGSFYPAYRGATISPTEALRHE